MEYEHLRPLGVGEVLDSAFRLCRKRFGSLIAAVAMVVIPLALVQLVITLSIPTNTRVLRSGSFTYRTTTTSSGAQLLAFLVPLLISGLNIALAQGAAMRILTDHYLGTDTSWSASLRYAFTRFRSLIWIVILGALAWIGGGILCLFPGIYLYVSFSVTIPALLIEDARGPRALGRSRALVQGRWWPTFATLLVVWLITTTLTLVVTGFVGGSTFLFANTASSTATRVATGLLTAGVNVLVTPISAAVATLIYFDLRVRKEGFDVALLIQRLDGPSHDLPAQGSSTTVTVEHPVDSPPVGATSPCAASSPWSPPDVTEPPTNP